MLMTVTGMVVFDMVVVEGGEKCVLVLLLSSCMGFVAFLYCQKSFRSCCCCEWWLVVLFSG